MASQVRRFITSFLSVSSAHTPHTHTHTHTLCTHSMRRVLLASITGANKHRQRATATLHGNQRGCPTNSHPPTSSTCIHTQAMPVMSGQSDFKAVQKRLFNLTISTCGVFVAYPPLHIQHTHTNMHIVQTHTEKCMRAMLITTQASVLMQPLPAAERAKCMSPNTPTHGHTQTPDTNTKYLHSAP